MLILVITLWEIVGKLKKLSAKSHLLRNFLAIRLPDCCTFSTYANRIKMCLPGKKLHSIFNLCQATVRIERKSYQISLLGQPLGSVVSSSWKSQFLTKSSRWSCSIFSLCVHLLLHPHLLDRLKFIEILLY